MAIWDINEDKITGSADSHKCLSCGGNLMYQPAEGILKCRHCGNEYFPEAFDVNDMLANMKVEEAGEQENAEHEIVCNSCGATVITEKNTMSTFCAFCGSPAVVNRSMGKAFRPDYVIPFTLTHKEAEAKIKEWASTRKLLPFSFHARANYQKLTGLYVPFWLVDAECHMNTVGYGVKKEFELGAVLHNYYDVRRQGVFKMNMVPFDGSKKINDRIMEAIEPFDYSKMVPFNIGYLQGFYSEKYDQTPEDLSVRITNRFRDYMYQVSREYMQTKQYSEYHIEEDKSKPEKFVFKYALMPVWFMSFKYKKLYYKIAVNGQTGEVAGVTPESDFKLWWLKFLKGLKSYSIILLLDLIVAGAMAVFATIYASMESTRPLTGSYFWLTFIISYIICLVLTLCNALGIRFMDDNSLYGKVIEKLVIPVRNELASFGNDINAMDEMPDVYQYIDKTQRAELEMTDTLSSSILPDSLIADDDKKKNSFGKLF